MASSILSAAGHLLAIDPALVLEPWAYVPPPPPGPPPAPTGLLVDNEGVVTWDYAGGRVATDYEYYTGTGAADWQQCLSRPFTVQIEIGVPVHLRVRAGAPVPAGLQAQAQAGGIHYAADFIMVSGITDATQMAALEQLETLLKEAGLLSNVSRQYSVLRIVYPFVGGTSFRHALNFVDPWAYALTFYGSPAHTLNGVAFDGVSQYADTGFAAALLGAHDVHLAFYADAPLTDPGRSGQGVIGSSSGSTAALLFAVNRQNTSFFSSANNNALVTWNQPGPRAGLFLATRTDNATAKTYFAGQEVATSEVVDTGTMPAATITIGLVNGTNAYSQVPCSFASAGPGLSPEQVAAYSLAIQNVQTTLGRAR